MRRVGGDFVIKAVGLLARAPTPLAGAGTRGAECMCPAVDAAVGVGCWREGLWPHRACMCAGSRVCECQ